MIDARFSKGGSVNLFADYSAATHYQFTRLALKHPIRLGRFPAGTFSLGIEGIAQGNKDLFTLQEGGLIEVHFGPGATSIGIKAGYKETRFSDDSHQHGTYMGIGVYTAFR